MNCWSVLGLEAGADERSVKRAYARLLKVHRPDEDAAAFQRLREAYDRALQLVRRPEPDDDQHWPAGPEPVQDERAQGLAPAIEPVQPAAAEPGDQPALAQPPEISLQKMYAWLEQGRDREVLDAVRTWLASDWLLPFDRRADFEQHLLELVEHAQWSPAFFEALSRLMGWDDQQGHLPCQGWRWQRLIERCHDQAWLEALQRTLNSEAERATPRGRAAAFLLAPMSDTKRRRTADWFSQAHWQACVELASALEYQHPDASERLGVPYYGEWRNWLPRSPDKGLYVGFWALLSLLLGGNSVLEYQGSAYGWGNALLCAAVSAPLALWIGTAVYHLWWRAARSLVVTDVSISRSLLPARHYRGGSGLLLLRHVFPLVIASVLISTSILPANWLRLSGGLGLFIGGYQLIWLSAERRLGIPERLKPWLKQLPWPKLYLTGVVLLVGALMMAIKWLSLRY